MQERDGAQRHCRSGANEGDGEEGGRREKGRDGVAANGIEGRGTFTHYIL